MKREEVYKAIDSERDYQDSKWGDVNDPDYVSYEPAQFLIDIELHLARAKQANYNIDKEETLNELRKIAALAVKCGEVHGMNAREMEYDVPGF